MKNYLFTFVFMLFSIGLLAQSRNNKLGITAGGGPQNYRGDLGNGFKLKNESSYGDVSLNVNYYISKSLDLGLFGTMGDYGFCQPEAKAKQEISVDERCKGCLYRKGIGNLSSRLTTGGVLVKYKLANGYLFNEDIKLKPYLYVGFAINNVADNMKMECVNAGNYFSINGGGGLKYYFNSRINIGYNLAFGYFTSDNIDFKMNGYNDMYMQNSLFLGIDLF